MHTIAAKLEFVENFERLIESDRKKDIVYQSERDEMDSIMEFHKNNVRLCPCHVQIWTNHDTDSRHLISRTAIDQLSNLPTKPKFDTSWIESTLPKFQPPIQYLSISIQTRPNQISTSLLKAYVWHRK